ncbi:MAG: 30S ribosomal protein S11 [Parcubacteria group bacterium]|nr:30S ribosomal protein S11 [Parcubacteria group bacterium]
MGKKRIIKKSAEEMIREREELESTIQRSATKGTEKKATRGEAHIMATYNNVMITMTDERGNVLAWASSGSLGFRGAKKSTPFASTRVAEAVAEKVKRSGLGEISVFVQGIGAGRDAAIRALANQGFAISVIKDMTPMPHNGCRPRKVRRV